MAQGQDEPVPVRRPSGGEPQSYAAELVTRDLFGTRVNSIAEYSSSFVGYGLLVRCAGLAVAMLYGRLAPQRLLSDLQREDPLLAPTARPRAA